MEWGECSHVCGNEGTWQRTFRVEIEAAHGGLQCDHKYGDTQERPCNRHKCGCSHLHCVFESKVPGDAANTAIITHHMGKHEKWGTQHKCKMVRDVIKYGPHSRCHCLCGDPSIVEGTSSDTAVKKHMDWFNHAHKDFIQSEHNKYFGYQDQQEKLTAKGKSRNACMSDVHRLGNGGTNKYDAHNTNMADCGGNSQAQLCKSGHRGDEPVTGNCDESQTKHPSASPTHAPTAIGHDGWGGLKFGSSEKVAGMKQNDGIQWGAAPRQAV